MKKQFYNGRLDAARGIAAIIVFLEHIKDVLLDRLGDNHIVSKIMQFLAVHAVLVFFLLSGFLITKSIIENTARNGTFSANDYLASRFTRIYPPLIGAILICCLAWLIIHSFSLPGSVAYGLPGDVYRSRESYSFQPIEILQALAMRESMLNVDGPLWTLFIEFQIYLMALAVALFWQPNKVAKMCGLAIGLLAFTFIWDVGHVFLIFIWGLGSAMALFTVWRRWSVQSVIFLAAMLCIVAIKEPRFFDPIRSSFGYEAVQFSLCCIYCVVLFSSQPLRPYPTFLVSTGHFSYSLYVVHFPLLLLGLSLTQNFVGHSTPRALLSAAIISPVVLVVAAYFARFAENQRLFLRLIKGAAPARSADDEADNSGYEQATYTKGSSSG